MPYNARMELGVFRDPADDRLRAPAVRHLCRAFQGIDEDFLAAHPRLPPVTQMIREGRVRVQNVPRACDADGCFIAEDPWRDISAIVAGKDAYGRPDWHADERDLAVWNAAEQVVRLGRPAHVAFLRSDMSPIGRLYVARMRLGLFNGQVDVALSDKAIRRLCHAFQSIAEDYLRTHPEIPPIYDLYARGLMRYQREDKVCDENGCRIVEDPWMDVPRQIEVGESDCEDIATWYAAEQVVRHGIPAYADILATNLPPPDGRRLYHIIVRRRDRPFHMFEDPSLKLGMQPFGAPNNPSPYRQQSQRLTMSPLVAQALAPYLRAA